MVLAMPMRYVFGYQSISEERPLFSQDTWAFQNRPADARLSLQPGPAQRVASNQCNFQSQSA